MGPCATREVPCLMVATIASRSTAYDRAWRTFTLSNGGASLRQKISVKPSGGAWMNWACCLTLAISLTGTSSITSTCPVSRAVSLACGSGIGRNWMSSRYGRALPWLSFRQ